MNKHAWIAEVMCDLESYMLAHGGKNSCAAVRFARFVVEEELCPREEAKIVNEPTVADFGYCQLVVDNSWESGAK